MNAYRLDEPANRHTLGCAVWLSNDPCDCGADDTVYLLRPEVGSTAHRLDALEPQDLSCDQDGAA